ncbi:sigma-70 family RNA polymerase sigma factor [Arthrobacter sp. Soc17.1.1.1]|uniref:sigma-70 family RNA polymerase sigma factor n=1 Tax=Arthrobacter sp. Soc17.1.1.1 TaxID=3121277 RepID=UPI002FE46E40
MGELTEDADAVARQPPLRVRLRLLMERVAARDEAAFEMLLTLMGPRIFAVSAKVLINPHIALEVTQEVLFEIWRKADTYDTERGHPDTWIVTMAHRRALDRRDSEERTTRHDTDYFIRNFTREYDQTSETALDTVEHDSVRALLKHLAPKQREALYLAFYDGLTYELVAARQSVPLATVKTRIRDARIVLRKKLTAPTAARHPDHP